MSVRLITAIHRNPPQSNRNPPQSNRNPTAIHRNPTAIQPQSTAIHRNPPQSNRNPPQSTAILIFPFVTHLKVFNHFKYHLILLNLLNAGFDILETWYN